MNIDTIKSTSFFVSASIPKNFSIIEQNLLDNKISIKESVMGAVSAVENSQSSIRISSPKPLVAPIVQS